MASLKQQKPLCCKWTQICRVLRLKTLFLGVCVCECDRVRSRFCILMCHACVLDRASTCVALPKPSNLCLSQSERHNAVSHRRSGRAKARSAPSITHFCARHCNFARQKSSNGKLICEVPMRLRDVRDVWGARGALALRWVMSFNVANPWRLCAASFIAGSAWAATDSAAVSSWLLRPWWLTATMLRFRFLLALDQV